MSIEYKGTVEKWVCDHCKKVYYIPLTGYPPKKCECLKNKDPWLYDNAIVELIYPNGDRETVRYTGQEIKTAYCVLGTPWEMVLADIKSIAIDSTGQVLFEYHGVVHGIVWITCPESLKGYPYDLQRPDWTKYLPVKK